MKTKKILSLILCVLVTFAALCMTASADDYAQITYHESADGFTYTDSYAIDEGFYADAEYGESSYYYCSVPDDAHLIGWATEPDGEVVYDKGEFIGENFPTDLYAVWYDILLGRDEVFYFNNSSYYFDVDGEDRYYMSDKDYSMMQQNLYKNYGIAPYPTPIVSIVLATYPNWEWQGSCYGMSIVTLLQHYGLIDILPMQDAVGMADMELDEELASYINYYQSQTATSWLCENKALIPGSPVYKQTLRDLYDTVSSGNIVLFTFYYGSAFVTPGHTVLFTGAYTNKKGEHVFIAYDCNRPSYYRWYDCPEFVASSDFSRISYDGEDAGSINWTADVSQFTSFNIDGSGTPTAWYQSYFAHIGNLFTSFFRMIGNLFR